VDVLGNVIELVSLIVLFIYFLEVELFLCSPVEVMPLVVGYRRSHWLQEPLPFAGARRCRWDAVELNVYRIEVLKLQLGSRITE
jgi:hypothetical protein